MTIITVVKKCCLCFHSVVVWHLQWGNENSYSKLTKSFWPQFKLKRKILSNTKRGKKVFGRRTIKGMRSGTDVRSSQHHLHHHCYINWTLAKCSIYECNITSTASSLMSPLPSHLAINQQYHSKPTLTECSVTLRWALPAIGWGFFSVLQRHHLTHHTG